MLRSSKEITGYPIAARDGDIGRCKDFLFDDVNWTIRYMLADTGKWIPGRKVLISPMSMDTPDWGSKRIPVRLTREQVEKAPSVRADEPVSRQHEAELLQYYGYPYYWGGEGLWGMASSPAVLAKKAAEHAPGAPAPAGDPHLRSVKEVTGYHISARDGEIGHVEEFILDDDSWKLRYIVVDTRNWLPGKKVVVSPDWVEGVDWAREQVEVDLTREQIRESPPYDPNLPVNRDYELRLYDFYGRPVYWQ